MINSIDCIGANFNEDFKFEKQHDFKFEIDINPVQTASFTLKIIFDQEIVSFRNHDYEWAEFKGTCIATELSTKLIRLSNGRFLQPSQNIGIWEVDPKTPKTLLWHFKPNLSEPIVNYTGQENFRRIKQATATVTTEVPLLLLISPTAGLEVSRSKIPFSAIACFTDHCDFDTLENLILQRQFFKKHQIKITKGFFLNQFSTREDNASWELHQTELEKWVLNGHELAYHSLSQSIKSDAESLKDFYNLIPPIRPINIWIDHGYQPYNFTLYKKTGLSEAEFSKQLTSQHITTLWNYIDSGTATKGVINQLNHKHFTLSSFWKGVKPLGLKKAINLMVKNCLFHYFNNEKKIKAYKLLSVDVKSFFINRKFSALGSLLSNSTKILPDFAKILLFWNSKKDIVYPLAKYSPIIFKHHISNQEFDVFQTIEMVDFKTALCKYNIDLLCKEKGLSIAHTYFSVPLAYHQGRLFKNETTIDPAVDANFKYLSEKIAEKRIWNPTLSELQDYIANYKNVRFDCDEKGTIYVKEATSVKSRKVID